MSVCERNKKQELNTLDETDFVRDVENRDYHYVSHFEIGSDKRISQHLSIFYKEIDRGQLPSSRLSGSYQKSIKPSVVIHFELGLVNVHRNELNLPS